MNINISLKCSCWLASTPAVLEGPVCCRFSWDEVKYPTTTPLREVVNAIQDIVAKLDLMI